MKGAWVSKRTTPTLLNGLNSEGIWSAKVQSDREATHSARTLQLSLLRGEGRQRIKQCSTKVEVLEEGIKHMDCPGPRKASADNEDDRSTSL